MSVTVSVRGETVRAARPRSALAVSSHTSFLPKRTADRHGDGWTTQNYSSTGILGINISCKNTPSNQEQKNQQVHQGATGGRHVGRLYLDPLFLGIISSSDFCTWISICGFSDGPRVEGPPFDVFINMYCLFVKCATKLEGGREHKRTLNHREVIYFMLNGVSLAGRS